MSERIHRHDLESEKATEVISTFLIFFEAFKGNTPIRRETLLSKLPQSLRVQDFSDGYTVSIDIINCAF
jgi:hypothetical protein